MLGSDLTEKLGKAFFFGLLANDTHTCGTVWTFKWAERILTIYIPPPLSPAFPTNSILGRKSGKLFEHFVRSQAKIRVIFEMSRTYRVIHQQSEVLVQYMAGDVVSSWEGPEDLIGWKGFCARGSGRGCHLTHPQHGSHYFTAGLGRKDVRRQLVNKINVKSCSI